MAGSVTHAFFANDVIKEVNKKRKILFNDDYINIYAQSMDPFNFYSILFPIKKNSNKIRGFSSIFHRTKTNEFFIELVKYIKDNNLSNDVEVMSFLYGYITHYVLDSSLHPFVEYNTGKWDKKKKETYKYNAKHHEMETFLDIYILKKNNIIPKKYKSYKILFNVNKFGNNLSMCLDYTFSKVYNFKNFSKLYLKSIKDMKFCFRILRYDPLGYKKYFYKVFDIISTGKVLNSKFLSYSYLPKNSDIFLNKNNSKWFYPYDESVKLNDSFDDIYDKAKNKCVDIIIKVTDYIKKNKELDLNSLFNLSYVTGLDWTLKNSNPKYKY